MLLLPCVTVWAVCEVLVRSLVFVMMFVYKYSLTNILGLRYLVTLLFIKGYQSKGG